VSERDLSWELFRDQYLKTGVPVIIVASSDPYGQGVPDGNSAAAAAISTQGSNQATGPTPIASAVKSSPGSRNDETAICEQGDSSGASVSTDAAGDGTDEGSVGGTDSEGVNSDNEHKRRISSSTSSSSSSIAAQTARAGEAYRQVPKQLLAQCGDVRSKILKWVHACKNVKETNGRWKRRGQMASM